jgi:hypothetical protein
MKSTLPDIGKMKSELQEENERLRLFKPKLLHEEFHSEELLHIGFLFSSPLILKV